MSTNNQVSLNIEELKGFVTHIVENNRFLQKQGKKPVAIEVIGDSGIGKTTSILQLADELNLNYVKLNLAQIEELGDLVGFPVRQFQLCKKTTTGDLKPAVVALATVPSTRKVKKTVTKTVTEMETRMVEEFDVKITKKQVLEGGKFVTKEIETKVPKMVEKEVPVEKEIEEEIEVDEIVELQDVETVQVASADGDYECLWVDENAVDEYVKRGYEFTGNKQMAYCPPQWIADQQGGGILILDDWNRAQN
jgi:flagellar biosynthesis GTPase FlhF